MAVYFQCYFNGSIYRQANGGVSYNGGNSIFILVEANTSIIKLKRIICQGCGFDSEKVDVQIQWRMPLSQDPPRYDLLPVNDSGIIQLLFDRQRESSNGYIELYVDFSRQQDYVNTERVIRRSRVVSATPTSTEALFQVDPNTMNEIYIPDEDRLSSDEEYIPEDDTVSNDGEYSDTFSEGSSTDEEGPPKIMEPPHPGFVDVSWADQNVCSDWANCYNDSVGEDGDISNGTMFYSKEAFTDAIKAWHIARHRQFSVKRTAVDHVSLVCKMKDTGCRWSCRCSLRKSSMMWVVSKLNEPHSCRYEVVLKNHRNITSEFVADKVHHLVRADLGLPISVIRASIFQQFQYNISYSKAWRAKQKVLERMFGTHEEAFPKLPRLFAEILRSNPGSVVEFNHRFVQHSTNTATFEMVFWAFGAAIEGFRFCRPLLSIDGTHLYGKYNGKLLVAVAYDSVNALFPLCFAIVDSETAESWGFFCRCLREFVTQRDLCIMSDRHAGIIQAVRIHLPTAKHRFCVRHIVSNFNTRFKNTTMKKYLYTMASRSCKWKFEEEYANFCKTSSYKRWIERIPLEQWSLVHDGGYRYGVLTTNLAEIFNNVMKGSRGLPMTAIVLLTFYRSNDYFTLRRKDTGLPENLGKTFPFIVQNLIDLSTAKSRKCRFIGFNHLEGLYEVEALREYTSAGRVAPGLFRVNLNDRSCDCGEWQIFHIPCPHALTVGACWNLGEKDMVSPYFTSQAHHRQWLPSFNVMNDPYYWPNYEGVEVVGDPSRFITKRGRRKTARIHNEMDAREKTGSNNCGKCKQPGHNRKTCKA